MPRSRINSEQADDSDFAFQLELDQVKDNNRNPAVFDHVVMNNYDLWLRTVELAQTANDSNLTFYTPGPLDPYIEVGEISWKSFATFIYRGTSVWVPSKVKYVASRSRDRYISSFRIYDVTNNNVIMMDDYSDDETILYNVNTLNNLPEDAAVFDCQAKRSSSHAGKTRIHALGLYY